MRGKKCNSYCYTTMSNGQSYCNKTIQCYFAPWLRLSLVTSKSLYKSSMNFYVVFFHGCFHRKTMVKCQCSVPCLMVKSQFPIIFDGYTVIPHKFPQFLMLRWQIPNGLGVGVERSTATGGAWLRLEVLKKILVDLVCSGNSPKMVILWN